jgi:D-aminopeptidase
VTQLRIRDLGITIGRLPTGANNAITDVPGVLVGHHTIIADEPRVARTGVTIILPRDGAIWEDNCFAGHAVLNGAGEMTGTIWLAESGVLESAIAITNTNDVGAVRDALIAYAVERGAIGDVFGAGHLPLVAETWDGWLSDIHAFHVKDAHVRSALAQAQSGPVPEGNVGGGTGMICHEFKGGIGTASRITEVAGERYTVGALVQANYGKRADLRIAGVPIGQLIPTEDVPSGYAESPGGSIIVVIATDAPLLALQCQRLARQATVGLARVGGVGHNGSGDIFLAFATGNHIPPQATVPIAVRMLPHSAMSVLFDAAAEAVEEAILNALAAAETQTGFKGHVAYALPLDRVREIIARWVPSAS